MSEPEDHTQLTLEELTAARKKIKKNEKLKEIEAEIDARDKD